MERDVQPRQIRAARGLLDWSQSVLAERAGVSVLTVKRLEDEAVGASEASYTAVVRALENGGIVFLLRIEGPPGAECGVALRAP